METEKGGDYQYRIPLMASQVETLFNDVPDGLTSFALASQISQAEAMKFFVERFRLHKGEKNGIIWWNLLDGWPQFSDAVVDYFYTKKPAYFILRNAQQPVYFMLDEPVNGVSRVVGANEYRHDVATRLKITNTETGELLLEVNTSLPANAAISVGTVAVDSIPAIYLLEWDGTDGVHRDLLWFYVNSWGRDKTQINRVVSERIGPARFSCMAEQDSFPEIGFIKRYPDFLKYFRKLSESSFCSFFLTRSIAQ